MNRPARVAAPLLLALAIVAGHAGCAYRLGPTSGAPAGARSLAVLPFENQTFEPRVTDSLATALRGQLQQEGTFRLARRSEADIVVSGVVRRIDRLEESFLPQDTRVLRDYRWQVVAHVTAIERASGRVLLDREVQGHTLLRIQPDLPSAERQSMPLLAGNLARNITSLLVDGEW
ncbi:MAG: hypothetical protein KF833_12930 [Verrucomicrobiae bacterium]|nr:hypothetical protein [Verrucomicrobiae bacterium]